MPPTNRAAWITGKQVRPLEVKPAPYTTPGPHELVIKTHAIALNPVDSMKQLMGDMMMSWIPYPFILGSDVSGEVIEVGSQAVSRFQVGDRVLGHAVSIDKRSNRACEGAFQEYVVLRDNLASKIPDSMSFERACVLPLGLSTAACGLFMEDYLALDLPTSSSKKDMNSKAKPRQALLVWGGSTSVGSNAIQLATAAGYEVFTTCSPKNFGYLTGLGAVKAFDYRSLNVIADIKIALKGKEVAGAFAIGDGSMEACIDIVAASQKGRKFIAQASVPQPDELPPKGMALVSFVAGFLWWNVSVFLKCKIKGIGAKFIWGDDLMANEVGKAIYEDFLPEALAEGRFVTAPEPYVVGEGLESIQMAMDTIMKGVSAKKVVVTL